MIARYCRICGQEIRTLVRRTYCMSCRGVANEWRRGEVERDDEQRRLWILNDEGLYDAYRLSGLSMGEFIRQHRPWIDRAIEPVLNGSKPAHYLKYDLTILGRERFP